MSMPAGWWPECWRSSGGRRGGEWVPRNGDGGWFLSHPDADRAALDTLNVLAGHVGGATSRAILCCVVGNPFRPVAVDSAWLVRNGGTVAKLAEAAYQERLP